MNPIVVNDLVVYPLAGENLSDNDALYISSGTGVDSGRTAGRAYKLDVTQVGREKFVGFAKGSATSGVQVKLAFAGKKTGFTGLIQGTTIWASLTVPGSYQTSEPTATIQVLGIAQNTTTLLINAALAGSYHASLSTGSGGGSGVGGTDIMVAQTADSAVLGDFTQNNLEIVTSPILHGTKSFRLIHQAASTRDFKQIISVDPKFRGKNLTLSLDVMSSALMANLNILFRDETNSADIGVSQQIQTNGQSITGDLTITSNQLTAMSNADVNKLKVGMIICHANLATATKVTAINVGALSATLSNNASASSAATSLKISDLDLKRNFTFDVPNNCSSVSYKISALQEAGLPETYVDDIVIQITQVAAMTASITIPVNNDTDWAAYTPTFTGLGTVTSIDCKHRRVGSNLEIMIRGVPGTTTAVVGAMTLPSGLVISSDSGSIRSFGILAMSETATGTIPITVLGTANGTSLNFGAIYLAGSYGGLKAENGSSLFTSGMAFSGTASIPIQGWSANQTQSKTIDLTTAVLQTQPDSYLRIVGFNGNANGSTATYIASLASGTVQQNIGSALQYLDDAVNGARFISQTEGLFRFIYNTDSFEGTGAAAYGFSLNSSSLTTLWNGLPASEKISCSFEAGNVTGQVTGEVYLRVGDVVRIHRDTLGSGSSTVYSSFTASYIGSTKIINPSSDQKIEIPSSELRFDGASTRGAVDTAVVKFDTLTSIRGDAFSIVNNANNGTVVTMTKAGLLSVSGTVSKSGSGGAFSISKNAVTLTGFPEVSSQLVAQQQGTASSDTVGFTSGLVSVKAGDVIRIHSLNTITSAASNFCTFLFQEQKIQVALSNVNPNWTQTDSEVVVNTLSGYGSTNTKILRFSNLQSNVGSDITYVDSASLGGSFTINSDGVYDISFDAHFNSVSTFGMSRNSSQLTTNLPDINIADILSISDSIGSGYRESMSKSVNLLKGDVIRAHADSAVVGTGNKAHFSITKVGKPNLSSVDVTPFVNIKTREDVTFRANGVPQTPYTINTPVVFSGVVEDPGKLYNTTTGQYTSPISGNMTVSYYINTDVAINTESFVYVNGIARVRAGITYSTSGYLWGSTTIKVLKGDLIDIRAGNPWSAVGGGNSLTISYQKDIDSIATPNQQVSSDTMNLAYAGSGSYTPSTLKDAPIGTFITFTYAASTNTRTQTTSAPTQTTSDMNTNGLRIYTRGYTSASTAALPTAFAIQIGKGLKADSLRLYKDTTRTIGGSLEAQGNLTTTEYGIWMKHYDENTGVYYVDAGVKVSTLASTHSFLFDDITLATDGYFVINASTIPALASIPILQPRIAYVLDTKSAGTDGGTFTNGAWRTRDLNTIRGDSSIVTLSSNQFTLQPGFYSMEIYAPAFSVNNHKCKLYNITTSTDVFTGSSIDGSTSTASSIAIGTVTVTSATVFEIQHRCQTTKSGNGLGTGDVGQGIVETYASAKITKFK